MPLSKAFDEIDHNLLLVKLNGTRFFYKSGVCLKIKNILINAKTIISGNPQSPINGWIHFAWFIFS